jgi:hypothetical protein
MRELSGPILSGSALPLVPARSPQFPSFLFGKGKFRSGALKSWATGFDDSVQGARNIYELQLNPSVANKWVRIANLKSPRFPPEVSVLGHKLIVWNSILGQLSLHWAEVFDPVNGTCELVPNPPKYFVSSIADRILLSAALQNPDRLVVAHRVPTDRYSAIFYAYDLQHRSWEILEPTKRKLPRYHVVRDEVWLEIAVGVENTLYWIVRPIGMDEDIFFIAYDVNSDMWLDGYLKGLGRFFFQEYSIWGEHTRPSFFSSGEAEVLPLSMFQ